MALGTGLNLTLLIDGVPQILVQDLQVSADGKKLQIDGKNGILGFTPGAKMLSVSTKSAVMFQGPEFDAFTAVAENLIFQLSIPMGTKTLTSEGEFTTCQIGQSVNGGTEISFEFVGTLEKPR